MIAFRPHRASSGLVHSFPSPRSARRGSSAMRLSPVTVPRMRSDISPHVGDVPMAFASSRFRRARSSRKKRLKVGSELASQAASIAVANC